MKDINWNLIFCEYNIFLFWIFNNRNKFIKLLFDLIIFIKAIVGFLKDFKSLSEFLYFKYNLYPPVSILI